MGGSVSSGQNNDELIDNLVEGGLIKSNQIERVFRCIDRGVFFLPDFKDKAYRDLAWREGNIHISAPCVYTKVLENLELESNLSFLNIGSGTGYLSSMVGLILGSNGVNHNIEIHEELINYANSKINEFVKNSALFDEFDFCVPKFVHGNCMNLSIPDNTMLYDRIYVGACVNQEQEQFITNLLKIGGILVMPSNDSLVKIKKINENCVSKKSVMNVSFASLINNQDEKSKPNDSFSLPKINPLSLQELCRFKIRQAIRESIKAEFPGYYDIKREKSTFNKTKPKNFESFLDDNHEDENEPDEPSNTDFPLTRFERIFSPNYFNTNENSNSFEHQIRLMIYGNLLDAANHSLQLAVNESRYEESDELDDLDELILTEHEDVHDDHHESNDENDSVDSLDESFRSFLNDFNMSFSEDDENDKTESDLFDLFHENCRRAQQTRNNLPNEIVLESERNNVPIMENCLPVTSKSLDESSSSPTSESSLDDGIDEDHDSVQRSSGKIPIIKRKRNASSGYSTSSNDFNSSLTEIVEDSENLHINNENKENSNFLTNCQQIEQKFIEISMVKNKPVKLNMLRDRVLKLNMSAAMKKFLLYHRDI